MGKPLTILWFRQDLRLGDNLALAWAQKRGAAILPIYILDLCAPQGFNMGQASKVWLHHSLSSLNTSLNDHLNVYVGRAHEIIEGLMHRHNIMAVTWNRCYEPWYRGQEDSVKDLCVEKGALWESFNSGYLHDPESLLKADGTPYKVFTPYKDKALSKALRGCAELPKNLALIRDRDNPLTLQALDLLPRQAWQENIPRHWKIGEDAAQEKIQAFLSHGMVGYKLGRNYPALDHTSGLSPHLHFGEISPVFLWHEVERWAKNRQCPQDVACFFSELLWREFSCALMHHGQNIHEQNINPAFNAFPWGESPDALGLWQKGQTGHPLVDAGMRELWQTGYMHNRVRMVVASFLVKNLNIHWRWGRDWFWDCLVDADAANNSASWQWVAGCGADAAPYFRVFNPVTQGEVWDAQGCYTRRLVPELTHLPDKYLFRPWDAPAAVLRHANITLGETYPWPMVDLAASRKLALERYATINVRAKDL